MAAPFFWLRRAGFRQLAILLLPAVLFLAFISAGHRPFSSLGEFGVNMHYNDGLMELLRMALETVLWLLQERFFCSL